MTRYRRHFVAGGTFFFTVALADRRHQTLIEHIDRFRAAYRLVHSRLPFKTIAICVLPDHLHAVWELPPGDSDYSRRWNLIKGGFSRGLPKVMDRSDSKVAKREKGIWQRRFWEHSIRDEIDLERHVQYIHYNPVKHGLVKRVADWPHSSFHRDVERGWLPANWGGGLIDTAGDFGE
jgi:putative transposase